MWLQITNGSNKYLMHHFILIKNKLNTINEEFTLRIRLFIRSSDVMVALHCSLDLDFGSSYLCLRKAMIGQKLPLQSQFIQVTNILEHPEV